VFLLGAYQEILGDLHNLFGDTNTAHVSMTEAGDFVIETIIKGETVTEVLNYVQFSSAELLTRLQTAVETAVLKNRIGQEEAGMFLKLYEDGLRGYTYLQ
jgi:arginine decarboxylase